ncbi:MAG: hypothetical protein HYZ89_04525 [Candidatus Omnitrophica bacterium]|nr:hypothetical protein [Candidatus Omnitrophota bacterium]
MRTLLVLMVLCAWSTSAWAKTMTVPKGTTNVNQLHDELLARFPAWRGTPQPDGTFTDPLLRVEHTDQEIRLMVPDTADETAVQRVVTDHVPKPPKDLKALRKSAKKKLKDLGLTQDEADAIISD